MLVDKYIVERDRDSEWLWKFVPNFLRSSIHIKFSILFTHAQNKQDPSKWFFQRNLSFVIEYYNFIEIVERGRRFLVYIRVKQKLFDEKVFSSPHKYLTRVLVGANFSSLFNPLRRPPGRCYENIKKFTMSFQRCSIFSI